MKSILSRAGRETLERFARSNVLLALDYDGTLAPIVREPTRAEMRGATRLLLAKVAAVYPCIVISGRARPDARRRLRGIRLQEIVGNHGIEPWKARRSLMEEVKRWTPLLGHRLSAFSGVHIEDKAFSVAIHYREAREKRKARAAILEAAAGLGTVRVVGGKEVINLLPKGAPHKGIALERERARLRRDTAIYVGDDETDEDVFGLDKPRWLLTVRVGLKRNSQASYYLRNQAAVDDFLGILLAIRLEPDLCGQRGPDSSRDSRA